MAYSSFWRVTGSAEGRVNAGVEYLVSHISVRINMITEYKAKLENGMFEPLRELGLIEDD